VLGAGRLWDPGERRPIRDARLPVLGLARFPDKARHADLADGEVWYSKPLSCADNASHDNGLLGE